MSHTGQVKHVKHVNKVNTDSPCVMQQVNL